METIEYRTIDKSNWPQGPWTKEVDKRQWPDITTALPCLIVRNRSAGHLCGYVGVPPGHPLHGKHYEEPDVDVHGGLTFAGSCRPNSEEHGICHIPGPGEPDAVWWFGFDCGHYDDVSPGSLRISSAFGYGTYKDRAFVQSECAHLARQLAALP